MSDDQATKARLSWQTVVAILSSIGVLLGIFAKCSDDLARLVHNTKSITADVRTTGVPNPSACYTWYMKAPTVLPYSLKNVIANVQGVIGLQSSLYWFHLRVGNQCKESLNINVSFHVRKGQATATEEPVVYTVEPKKGLDTYVDPAFTFLQDDIDTPLQITWKIQDVRGNVLQQGTPTIQVLSKSIFKWDLTMPDGSVPKDFLLASLAAWTITVDSEVTNLASKCIRSQADPRRWVAGCYAFLFSNPGPLQIIPTARAFPPMGEEKIRPLAHVLKDGRADPLEAALFLAAIIGQVPEDRVRMILVVRPDADQKPGVSRLFLAWSVDRGDWNAIDMAQANAQSFEDNERGATLRVAGWLKDQPGLMTALDRTGVFISGGGPPMALDFARAIANYHIRGLP